MKRLFSIILISLILTSCSAEKTEESTSAATESTSTTETSTEVTYVQITQEKAVEMMETETDYIILDVRRQDEFDEGHIPGAILVPNESIGEDEIPELPDKDQLILVYCRSGRRSKEASQKLAELGYTNVYEFGGIIDWDGEIVK